MKAPTANIYESKTRVKLFVDHFISGIGWGIGSILGAAILVTLVGFFAARIHAIPYIGEFVYGIIIEVQKLQGK